MSPVGIAFQGRSRPNLSRELGRRGGRRDRPDFLFLTGQKSVELDPFAPDESPEPLPESPPEPPPEPS